MSDLHKHSSEYWVHEVWYNRSDVVAIFDDEDEAQEWAEDNFDEVYGSMPVGIMDSDGSAYVTRVKRFSSGDSK